MGLLCRYKELTYELVLSFGGERSRESNFIKLSNGNENLSLGLEIGLDVPKFTGPGVYKERFETCTQTSLQQPTTPTPLPTIGHSHRSRSHREPILSWGSESQFTSKIKRGYHKYQDWEYVRK